MERILHEWGHAVQLACWALRPLREGWEVEVLVTEHLERQSGFLAERNEIRAIAITVGVARAVGLPITLGPLAWSAVQNSRLLCDGDPAVKRRRLRSHERTDLFERLASRAGRTPAVRRGVQEILDLLDREWPKATGWW